MLCFHDNLRQEINRSKFNYRQLSIKIGKGERYVANMLDNKSDPGLTAAILIAEAIDVPLQSLLKPSSEVAIQASQNENRQTEVIAEDLLTKVAEAARLKLQIQGVEPTIDDMLSWWHVQDGILGNFDRFAERFDLFERPTADFTLPVAHKLGKQSLASRSFGVSNPNELQKLLLIFGPGVSDTVLKAHATIKGKTPGVSIQEIDVTLPDGHTKLSFSYKRLLLPVKDPAGQKYIMSYSRLIG